MRNYEKLYFFKNNKKLVQKYIADFLLFQIYSPEILHEAFIKWPELPWFIKENTPKEMQDLIEKSPYFSDKILQEKIGSYQIQQAIDVLSKYQLCDVPLSMDPTVPRNRYKLTSKAGDKALSLLKSALKEKHFSDRMTDFAVYTTHKFLGKDKYYINWKLPSKVARALAIEMRLLSDGSIHYTFPAIQLTQGCLNRCSHCDSRAEPHLSQMPWPVFRALYRNLNKYYRHYPQRMIDHYFSQFFADSDMLDYHDSIMNVDSGDVGLWIAEEKGYCQYLTRGVKNERNRLALAKALLSGSSVAISFVDTPKENRTRNLKQINETLDVVESVPERVGNPAIIHLHLKSGPSVDRKIFRDLHVEDAPIYAMGRANDFPAHEVDHFPDKEFTVPCVIRPNGDIVEQKVKNSEVVKIRLGSFFATQHGPKISPIRLFIRRHILSRFK